MTIGQRRRHNSGAKRKNLMIPDEQEAKKHEAAQRLLFQMSDVQGELYKKKQQVASRKGCAAELQRKKMRICAATFDNQEKVKDFTKEGENVIEDFNQLLLLANSVELMESEDVIYGALRKKGKVRLTSIRRRARLRNPQWKQAELKRLEDTHGAKSVEVDRVHGVMHQQNVQEHCDELQQQLTNVEDANRTSSIKQKIRLTQLKCEARLKYSPLQLKN